MALEINELIACVDRVIDQVAYEFSVSASETQSARKIYASHLHFEYGNDTVVDAYGKERWNETIHLESLESVERRRQEVLAKLFPSAPQSVRGWLLTALKTVIDVQFMAATMTVVRGRSESEDDLTVGQDNLAEYLFWAATRVGSIRGWHAAESAIREADKSRLSEYGRRGLEKRHAGTRKLKDWAVTQARGRSDRRMARQLLGEIPAELQVHVKELEDPTAVIYAALRAKKKKEG